jgi:hypothetical protein
MALLYRKLVRDAILSLLSDPSTGFNPTLAALAGAYGISPFQIDFTGASGNFAISHIDKSNIEHSQLLEFPGGCLYTTDAVDKGDPHGFYFAGAVMAHVVFFVRERQGVEGFNTEDPFDAIEDAVLSVVNRPGNQWPAGVAFQRQAEMSREYLFPLGDGYGTSIPIGLLFGVYVP